jgi:uncharacterized membrane protein YeaQ/YmgE (transglycosylase-associated protein family)
VAPWRSSSTKCPSCTASILRRGREGVKRTRTRQTYRVESAAIGHDTAISFAPCDIECAACALLGTTGQEGSHMGIIGWIIFGLIVGVVAKVLTPGRDPGGFIVTIILGILGAVLGGYLGRALGWYQAGDPVGFVVAVLGSILLLVLYRLVTRRTA